MPFYVYCSKGSVYLGIFKGFKVKQSFVHSCVKTGEPFKNNKGEDSMLNVLVFDGEENMHNRTFLKT